MFPWHSYGPGLVSPQTHQQFSVQRPSTRKKEGEKEYYKTVLAEEMLIQIWLQTVFSLTRLRNPGSGEGREAVTECRGSCFAAGMSIFAGLWLAKACPAPCCLGAAGGCLILNSRLTLLLAFW